MAGPGFVIVVFLILVFVPEWAVIWGRKEPLPTVSAARDPGPERLGARPRSEA
jgi:hypothetical protein